MSEWVRAAVRRVGEDLSDEHGRMLERAILARHRARVRVRRVTFAGLAVAGAAAAATLLVAKTALPPAHVVASAISPTTRTVRLDDGSEVTLLDAASTLQTKTVTPREVVVALDAGRARFQVARTHDRTFRLRAGQVDIEVLGTVFTVEQHANRTTVAVERGTVRIAWPGGSTVLEDGGVGVFPPAPELAPPAPAEPAAPAPKPTPHAAAPTPWRKLAHAGAYQDAYRAMQHTREPVRDEPGDLLLAADVARYSDHAADAAATLHRMRERYPRDPRAPLAAFTEARLRLEQLGAPAQAAAAFAQARALDPNGALAEDALAREVEAWAKAGERGRAREAAERYLRQHPNGRRRDAVARFGGI